MGKALVLLGVALTLAGCGASQTRPHQWHGVAGLIPTQEDKDAGLVGIAPGFDPRRYAIMAVDRCTVVESEIKDAEDREFARTLPAFLQAEVVRRLSATGLFESVINLTAAGPPARSDPALRLECVITRLAPGSEVGRSALWAYGVGRSKLEAEFRFVEAQTNRVVMVTADRRVALRTEDGEVTSDALLRESCGTMARDLAKFLVRLSRGEAPRD